MNGCVAVWVWCVLLAARPPGRDTLAPGEAPGELGLAGWLAGSATAFRDWLLWFSIIRAALSWRPHHHTGGHEKTHLIILHSWCSIDNLCMIWYFPRRPYWLSLVLARFKPDDWWPVSLKTSSWSFICQLLKSQPMIGWQRNVSSLGPDMVAPTKCSISHILSSIVHLRTLSELAGIIC